MKEEEGRGGKEGQVREGKAENGMPGMKSSEGHGTERREGKNRQEGKGSKGTEGMKEGSQPTPAITTP